MKKLYKIEEIFPAAGDSRFVVEFADGFVLVKVVTATAFANAARYEYGERSLLCFPEDDALEVLYNRFYDWREQRLADISKEFLALRTSYKPLENYNSTETKTGTETGLKTPTNWKETKDFKVSVDYKETDTQRPTNWTETIDHSVSNDYKETDSQKPNNWKETTDHSVSNDYKETDSQKPNLWKESIDHKVSQDYKETDSEKPSNWKEQKETTGTDPAAANTSTSKNSVIPFNATDFVDVSKTTNENAFNETTERTGNYDREHTQTGTKTEERTQSGTFDTEHTQTGKKTDERTQSGTFATEHTQSGTRTEETAQSGTFEDKMTYNTTINKSGNIGVTTSQQMLQSEIELRSKNYARELIKEFFDLVTIYA